MLCNKTVWKAVCSGLSLAYASRTTAYFEGGIRLTGSSCCQRRYAVQPTLLIWWKH